MRKVVLAFAFLGGMASVQAQALNEVKLNIFNTIVNRSVEVGYEYFFEKDQSVGLDVMFNDRFSYWSESNRQGKYKRFNTNSVALNYNYHFGGMSGEHASGMVVSPFLKYRFGNYEKDINANQRLKVDMDSFIIGVGIGYKIVKNDAFTITPFANIGRNFSRDVTDEFPGVEFNAGINLGFRF